MTLIEIAERLDKIVASDKRSGWTLGFSGPDADIAFLLDAVVEERQKVIALDSWASWINSNQRGPMPTMIKSDYRDKALHELNLKGVLAGEKE